MTIMMQHSKSFYLLSISRRPGTALHWLLATTPWGRCCCHLFYRFGNGGHKRFNILPRFMLLAGDTASSNPSRLVLKSPWVSLGYADMQQQPKSIIFHLNAKQTKRKQNCLLRSYYSKWFFNAWMAWLPRQRPQLSVHAWGWDRACQCWRMGTWKEASERHVESSHRTYWSSLSIYF